MVYCRRSNTFAVTIGPVRWKKSDLGEWFVNSNEFLEVAIGEEKYSSVVDCDSGELVDDPVGRHQHIFLRSADKLFFKDVTAMVELFLDLVEEEVRPSINTVACRSAVHFAAHAAVEHFHPQCLHHVIDDTDEEIDGAIVRPTKKNILKNQKKIDGATC